MKSLSTTFCSLLLSLITAVGLAQDAEPAAESAPPSAPESGTSPGAPAEEAPPAETADILAIPAPYPVSRYEAAWSKNPFLRKTVVIEQAKESALKDWALNGMAEYDGKIRVTMVNKQTGEYKHVTNQDGADAEFRLIQANFNRNRADASAEIEKGGEKAVIKYDENLTSKPLTINNTQRQAAGAQGQPPQQGVQPGAVRPGQPVSATRGPPAAGGAQPPVQPGMAPVVNPGAQPMANSPVAPNAAAPPSISRRRQLVPVPPAPVIPAQQ
ncbi:MAG TPA: hypothetical protein VD994_04820 [Prosthecobacter sp.]|nr:hypothetical protein [Prosthecobacter sp.]